MLDALERLRRRPCLIALSYHRIGSAATDPYYSPMFSATRDEFASEVGYLRDHFRILGPGDLSSLAQADYLPDEPTAVITFDDGYRDNVELALPILRDLDVPAAFFITTDFIEHHRLPWWDQVALVLRRSSVRHLVLDIPEPLSIDLQDNALSSIINAYLHCDPDGEARNLAHLSERAEVDLDPQDLGRSLFMNWDDVRSLDAAGMIIGSHSVAHRNFARRSEGAQAASLAESRQILERELSHEIRTFAYPYGGPGDFTPATERLAQEAGYRVAFSLRNCVERPGIHSPLNIPRLVIGASDSCTLFRARMCLTATFGSSLL